MVLSFGNTIKSFISYIPRLTNNEFVYNVCNLLNIKCLYHKNLLLSFHKFKNHTVYINHIYNTCYKTNISLNVNFYHNNFGMKSFISIAIKLCGILRINIHHFNNGNDLKLYLNNVDLIQINL